MSIPFFHIVYVLNRYNAYLFKCENNTRCNCYCLTLNTQRTIHVLLQVVLSKTSFMVHCFRLFNVYMDT